MDRAIEELASTTFAGKRFTRKQLDYIQKTVNRFPNLSRRELGYTICENSAWLTPSGTLKIQTCLNALEEMQARGLFKLPPKAMPGRKSKQKEIVWTKRSAPQARINGSLEQLPPIAIRVVTEKEEIERWNELIDRYHYLGYRRPMGTHLRYFIVTEEDNEQILGCLLFSFPVWSLACRDQWIGWSDQGRRRHLELIVNNNRFLILPWVYVKHLASKVLALSCRRIGDDWERYHGFRPVLLETFVDSDAYKATSYKAANWQLIGKTQGRESLDPEKRRSQKEVYVYPLCRDYKAILNHEKKQAKPRKSQTPRNSKIAHIDANNPFILLWQQIIDIVTAISDEADQTWRRRKRVINTLLLILFIFRLVFSKNKQGYGITVVELWEQCRTMAIALPQRKPVAASAFCAARSKLDEAVFTRLNSEIIAIYESAMTDYTWKKRRLFAVDGSKINVPRALLKEAYTPPSNNAHYPQGLVSCLYQLKSQIPYDFDLLAHHDERAAALSHLDVLQPQDIVVYDRGYFSYAMLAQHGKRGLDAVFRLPAHGYCVIDEFMEGQASDITVIIDVSSQRRKEIVLKHPHIEFAPLKLRLIKYVRGESTYCLGTTLLDRERYPESVFPDLYHCRWGIEELYKISKVLIDVEDFHAQSERGVKQELFAHFVLITLHRIFANHTEAGLNSRDWHLTGEASPESQLRFKVNVKNSLITIARHLESLFLQQAKWVANTINTIFDSLSFCKQKRRPHRTYERKSMKPIKKWRPAKTKPTLPSTARPA